KSLHCAFYQRSAPGSGPSLANKKVLRYRQRMEPIPDRFVGLCKAARRFNALGSDCRNDREGIFYSMMELANYDFLQIRGKCVRLRINACLGEQLSQIIRLVFQAKQIGSFHWLSSRKLSRKARANSISVEKTLNSVPFKGAKTAQRIERDGEG